MINSRRLVDGLTGGRLGGDLTPQSLIVSRSDFYEYIHRVTSLWSREWTVKRFITFRGLKLCASPFSKQSDKNQTNTKESEGRKLINIRKIFIGSDFYVSTVCFNSIGHHKVGIFAACASEFGY
jgi:hypothetical protein